MTQTATADPLALPRRGEGWLILHVGLPRLIRQLDRLLAWVRRYSPAGFLDAANELRVIPGSEALALLAAVPPDARQTTIDRVPVDEEARERLRELADSLGDPEDPDTPAAALIRMYPSISEPARAIPGDDKRAADAFSQNGLHAWEQSHLEVARDWFERAREIYRRIADRRGEGAALGNLGLTYADLGQPRLAIDCLQQSLAIAREVGDRRGEGAALGNLGIAYKSLSGRPSGR
jgi:tetratricopeptide (TPR) repeat protein